ncbi:MAG: RNase adapter RapZ [Candidatus Muiribacteriota bacterium]
MKLLIVSGISGAGKSETIKILEDAGYFVVDNLPVTLINKFLELSMKNSSYDKIAVVIDVRGRKYFDNIETMLEKIRINDVSYKLLFLDASDEIIISRFKETRRKHPLGDNETIAEDISKEREYLSFLKEKADIIIDTTEISSKELREKILIKIDEKDALVDMAVVISSFGYKYGMIKDADVVFDVRFLPNPFYVDNLKKKTGLDKKVESYVMMWPNTKRFVEKFENLISFVLPLYVKEGKKQLHIAFGCTGGKHRSVTLAEHLSDFLKKDGYRVYTKHRDIEKRQDEQQ